MNMTRSRSRFVHAAQAAGLTVATLVLAGTAGTDVAIANPGATPSRSAHVSPDVHRPPAQLGAPGWPVGAPRAAIHPSGPWDAPGGLATEPQAVEIKRKGRIFCSDDDCSWLVAACDANNGGLSTEPDGTQVCTVYDIDD